MFVKTYTMNNKDTTVRVKPYTKELILKHSRKLKISQNDFIEKAILAAEQHNFSTEIPLKQIEKNQTIQANRIIGFLKTQDKNLHQVEQNIYQYTQNILRADRNEVMEFLYYTIEEELPQIVSEFYKGDKELSETYLERHRMFFNKLQPILRKNILQLGN